MGLGHVDALDLTPRASTLRRISGLSRLGALDIAPQTVSMDPQGNERDPREASFHHLCCLKTQNSTFSFSEPCWNLLQGESGGPWDS